jgi:hypothetical protein
MPKGVMANLGAALKQLECSPPRASSVMRGARPIEPGSELGGLGDCAFDE